MDRKNVCNCLKDCPCYPNCDQMMQEGRMGQLPPHKMWETGPGGMICQPGGMSFHAKPGEKPFGENRGRQDGRMPEDAWIEPEEEIWMPPDERALANGRTAGTAGTAMTLEEENDRDWQKIKELYPKMAQIVLAEVESLCDGMEYEGSPMFDQMPDKMRVRQMTDQIYEKVKDCCPDEESGDADGIHAMHREGNRPPRKNWLDDFIQVLLYQEMFHRRCRHRGCRHGQ